MARAEKVYPVRAILRKVYMPRYDRFFFRTEWEEKDAKGNHIVTNEPIENFRYTPTPIFEFGKVDWTEDEEYRNVLRRTKSEVEYVPNRSEFVKKVYNVFSTKVGRNAEEFYEVRFCGDKRTHTVRLIFME
jgi:hypothetical protein